MSEWEIKNDEKEFPVPSQPVNPMTPERLRKLREEADKRLLDLYYAKMNPSGSFDTRIKPEDPDKKS